MKIYTRTGDKGKTSLASGTRVSKTHPRIETYGTIDELTSHVALIRDMANNDEVKHTLLEVLDRLMTLGGILSFDKIDPNLKIPYIKPEDILFLERKIDDYTAQVPPLRAFVIPGGSTISSQCHIARCVCRRAERLALNLSEEHEVPELCLQYLNRLSDFLFILARKFLKDSNGEEITWIPRVD